MAGTAIDQTRLAVDDRLLINRGARQAHNCMRGRFDELEVRLVLVESRRCKRQECNIRFAYQLMVTLKRAQRLKELVWGGESIEKGTIIDDLNLHRATVAG